MCVCVCDGEREREIDNGTGCSNVPCALWDHHSPEDGTGLSNACVCVCVCKREERSGGQRGGEVCVLKSKAERWQQWLCVGV